MQALLEAQSRAGLAIPQNSLEGAYSQDGAPPGPTMTVADRETFMALRRVLPSATKVCLQDTFGISETTWVKLRDGRPIKTSTLERILARYRRLRGAMQDHAA